MSILRSAFRRSTSGDWISSGLGRPAGRGEADGMPGPRMGGGGGAGKVGGSGRMFKANELVTGAGAVGRARLRGAAATRRHRRIAAARQGVGIGQYRATIESHAG